jgi:hypothetical protein
MRVFAFKLNDRDGELQCEECEATNTKQPLYGVVANVDIAREDTNLTKRDTAEHVLWEKGIGQIICMNCINKKRTPK